MSKIPPHRSYSQLSTFYKCAHQYYLSKVAKVPEQPALYLAAGSAVHEHIEALNYRFHEERMQHV